MNDAGTGITDTTWRHGGIPPAAAAAGDENDVI